MYFAEHDDGISVIIIVHYYANDLCFRGKEANYDRAPLVKDMLTNRNFPNWKASMARRVNIR